MSGRNKTEEFRPRKGLFWICSHYEHPHMYECSNVDTWYFITKRYFKITAKFSYVHRELNQIIYLSFQLYRRSVSFFCHVSTEMVAVSPATEYKCLNRKYDFNSRRSQHSTVCTKCGNLDKT